jgi:two-component system chemotaxis response regulator CheB
MSGKIRVLVVDDSSLARDAIKSIFESDPLIEVVGEAKDGQEGVRKAFALKPNVITMDLKMPMLNGLDAIEMIMQELPTPIIVVSSMDTKVIVKALAIGAMDFVPLDEEIDVIANDLLEKVKIASKVKPLRRMKKILPVRNILPVEKKSVHKVVAIGVSTGGPQALQVLLSSLPSDFKAGIVVVQHISKGFIGGLAEWLRQSCSLDVHVARAGDVLKSSTIWIAPDEYNLVVDEKGVIGLKEDVTKKLLHVPSIDVMMESIADSFGSFALGVIMTGMGQDGVKGIAAIKDRGGFTIAQDEATSVVYGMNKVAVDKGFINKILPLDKMAEEIIRQAS